MLDRYTWRTFSREMVLVAGAIVFSVPFYLLITLSLKNSTDAFLKPASLPIHNPQFGNYATAWNSSGLGLSVGMGRGLLNSAIITVGSVACLIVFGSLGAYVLGRRRSKLATLLYFVFVLGIVMPSQLAILPLYTALRSLHLTGTYLGMILLWTGLFMPFTVFLYTGFVRTMPGSYEEAARVDGAGFFRTYTRVVFPLLLPITGTVAVIAGITIWNDFFTPLIFLSGTKDITLPVVLYAFVGNQSSQWNLVFAAVVITLTPAILFYLFAQRQLIRGFTGGIRG